MKFQIDQAVLLEGLLQVQSVVSSRATLPILFNVLIESDGDSALKLTTSNLETGMVVRVEAKVLEPGQTTLPARRLASVVKELSAREIEISIDDKNAATLKSGKSLFKLVGLSSADFPPLTEIKGDKQFSISQELLKKSLRKTSYAISSDATRYVLHGIFTSFKEGKMTMVATDGRRLAMVAEDLDYPQANEVDIIIPAKTITELSKLLSDEGEILVKIDESSISFELENATLVSKLISGNYPNYKQVIPGEARHRVTLDRKSFLETLRRVTTVSDKTNNVTLNFESGQLQVVAHAAEVGEAEETVEVNYTGDTLAISFNAEYIVSVLEHLVEEQVYLDLIDGLTPGVIRLDSAFLYVLMPIRPVAPQS